MGRAKPRRVARGESSTSLIPDEMMTVRYDAHVLCQNVQHDSGCVGLGVDFFGGLLVGSGVVVARALLVVGDGRSSFGSVGLGGAVVGRSGGWLVRLARGFVFVLVIVVVAVYTC